MNNQDPAPVRRMKREKLMKQLAEYDLQLPEENNLNQLTIKNQKKKHELRRPTSL